MRCDEVQTLHGPCLDSELDARTTLKIEQHLKSCPECARLFAEEQKLEARLKASLNQGTKTPALWEGIERAVVDAAARESARRRPLPRTSRRLFAALGEQLQAGWQRSRWAWSGLASAWAVILVLNSATHQPATPPLAKQEAPSASEMRLALKQKQQLMAELDGPAKPAPADKSKAAPPSPRSDRRKQTLNT